MELAVPSPGRFPPPEWKEVKEMKMIEGPLAPIYLMMLSLSQRIKYNPYDIGDHPGPVSEMKVNLDAFMHANA